MCSVIHLAPPIYHILDEIFPTAPFIQNHVHGVSSLLLSLSLSLSGPFFRYQTYVDWLEQTEPLSLPCKAPCLNRLKMVPVYAAFFISVNFLFPLSYVRTDDFLEHNFFYRCVRRCLLLPC